VKPICGAPARYGNFEATRRRGGHLELGAMWVCNRKVAHEGDRCWQHPRDPNDPNGANGPVDSTPTPGGTP